MVRIDFGGYETTVTVSGSCYIKVLRVNYIGIKRWDGFINWVDNEKLATVEFLKLTFRALALSQTDVALLS